MDEITIQENDLQDMIEKMAKENNATEEMIIEALKRWIEKYDKKWNSKKLGIGYVMLSFLFCAQINIESICEFKL